MARAARGIRELERGGLGGLPGQRLRSISPRIAPTRPSATARSRAARCRSRSGDRRRRSRSALFGIGLAAAVAPLAFVGHLVAYLVAHARLLALREADAAGRRAVARGAVHAAPARGRRGGGIALTPWLLAFSLFFFLGLAFAKRYGELARIGALARTTSRGAPIARDDLDLLMMLGTTSAYLSVLVLCLYINSDHVGAQYPRPGALWFLVPLLLYWVSRIWFLAKRGELPGDPVAFAVRDRVSLVVGRAGRDRARRRDRALLARAARPRGRRSPWPCARAG